MRSYINWNYLVSHPLVIISVIILSDVCFVLLLRTWFSFLYVGTKDDICSRHRNDEACKGWRPFTGDQNFTQFIDHNNPKSSSDNLFSQRYFVNAEYYEYGGPALIYVGGETSLTEVKVDNGLIVQLAKLHKGIIFGLEHRYYGKSHPYKKLTVSNMKYLTSEQALLDLVNFAKTVNNPKSKSPLPSNTKWFLIGGSYPGSLAAWGRQQYPDTFYGAIASSAPLEAKSDFFEYDVITGKALKEECLKSVSSVITYVDELYARSDKSEFKKLKEELECNDVKDDILFLYTMADTLSSIVQYNTEYSKPNINALCSGINYESTVEAKLKFYIKLLKEQHKSKEAKCSSFAGDQQLKIISHYEQGFYRQWMYQSCTEFGYFQTATKSGLSTRSKYITEDWFKHYLCGETFFKPAIGPPTITKTNSKYHGKQLKLDRTIITNGEFDPWSALSITTPPDPSIKSEDGYYSLPKDSAIILIKGSSHASDLRTVYVDDPKPLIKSYRATAALFRKWMES